MLTSFLIISCITANNSGANVIVFSTSPVNNSLVPTPSLPNCPDSIPRVDNVSSVETPTSSLLIPVSTTGMFSLASIDDVTGNPASLTSDPEGVLALLWTEDDDPVLADFSFTPSSLTVPSFSIKSAYFLFNVEFQWFLIALSVRPSRSLAMVAHLLPYLAWALMMISSSSRVNALCSTSGDSWLHHRNLQDFPDRPGTALAIIVQLRGPCFITKCFSRSSSSGLHGPLTRLLSIKNPKGDETMVLK